MKQLKKKEKDIEWDKIYYNHELKKEFHEFILNLSTKDLLWPEESIDKFPKKFILRRDNTVYVPFCYSIFDRLQCVEYKLRNWLENQLGRYEHPYVTYYYLQKFWEELYTETFDKSLSLATIETIKEIKLKNKSKRVPKEEKEDSHEKEIWLQQIQKLKRKLQVPKSWKNYDSQKIFQEIFENFGELSWQYHKLEKEKINLEIELERYKEIQNIPMEYKKEIENYKNQSSQLQKELLQERSRNQILEKEIQRLTEMIIENPTIMNQQEELESLKKEYQLLMEKYDLLVSKNIELRNHIEQLNQVRSLHEILNRIRDRVNKIIRTGGLSEEVMIIKIKNEIDELQRARLYLGKALYDIGLLYLRLGRKEEAFRELRAARELGVEDPEVNRFINQNL
ncbi:MAG: hypothetical protein NZ853_10735 [Leptospiraceae bacterium]|nr:hypothetical protein [Leptospiraceae bacterium]MDW7977071.1 hypothetical protein [Leptospiraceae bacterium]